MSARPWGALLIEKQSLSLPRRCHSRNPLIFTVEFQSSYIYYHINQSKSIYKSILSINQANLIKLTLIVIVCHNNIVETSRVS